MSTASNTERNRARRHAARDRRAFAREVENLAVLMAFVQGTEVNRAIRHEARDIIYEQRREAERLEAERLEAERLEAERLEAERLEAERLESERLEAERLEAERLEAEAEERRLRNRARRHAARDRRAAARLRIERINELADAVVEDEEHDAAVEAAVEAANNFLDGTGPFEFDATLLTDDLLLAVLFRHATMVYGQPSP